MIRRKQKRAIIIFFTITYTRFLNTPQSHHHKPNKFISGQCQSVNHIHSYNHNYNSSIREERETDRIRIRLGMKNTKNSYKAIKSHFLLPVVLPSSFYRLCRIILLLFMHFYQIIIIIL